MATFYRVPENCNSMLEMPYSVFVMNVKRTKTILWTAGVVIFGAWLGACGGPHVGPAPKEGDLEDLLNPPGEGSEVPLAARALNVEQVATELPPQVDEYRIGPNDILNITVLEHEEFSSARDFNRGIVGTIVKKDGNIYLPIIGPILVTGYTVEEIHGVLQEHIGAYVKEPHLTVDVLQYESQKYFVLGEVKEPGVFPVDGDTTLLEAIGLAKGVLPRGNLERAYVVRNKTLLPINLADILLRGDMSRNIYLKSGDLIYIPGSEDQKVYVLGEVKKPGLVKIERGRLSLAQAIASVGGILHVEARKRSIKQIRGNWQEPTVYTLSYDSILDYGDRILLQPGDRIVVAPTALTTMSRYMEQILPFLLGADYATRTYDRMSP